MAFSLSNSMYNSAHANDGHPRSGSRNRIRHPKRETSSARPALKPKRCPRSFFYYTLHGRSGSRSRVRRCNTRPVRR